MKPFEASRNVESIGIIKTVDYHIDPKNIAHITQILRNMYADPILAVVREYCANAVDAHMAAGIPDTPIEVTLPSTYDPTLSIRDFGNGLSETDVRDLLCGYGASGKAKRTGALADQMIGGFGIGCKSAYAVSDQFTYTVYHKARKAIWNCFLDEHDAGKAALLSDEPCDAASGVEVKIPIKPGQISSVILAACRAFQWYATPPTIRGMPAGSKILDQYPIVLDGWVLNNTVRWCFVTYPQGSYKSAPASEIVMGGVSYPLNWDKVDPTGLAAGYRQREAFPYHRLVLHAPIGYFAIAPSREEIQYSSKVIKDLNHLFNAIVDDTATRIETNINQEAEGWPRIVKAAEITDGYVDKLQRTKTLTKLFDRQTFGVAPSYYKTTPDAVDVVQVVYPVAYYRKQRMRISSMLPGTTRHYFLPSAAIRFGWSNDTISAISERLEAARLANALPVEKYAYIFIGQRAAEAKLIQDLPWLANAPIDDIDTLYPRPKRVGTGGRTGGCSNITISNEKWFKLRTGPLDPQNPNIGSQWWDPVATVDAKKLFTNTAKPVIVVLDNFRAKLMNAAGYMDTVAPWDLVQKQLSWAEKLQVTSPDVYAVKLKTWDNPKFDRSRIVRLEEHIDAAITQSIDGNVKCTWQQLAAGITGNTTSVLWHLAPHHAKLTACALQKYLAQLNDWFFSDASASYINDQTRALNKLDILFKTATQKKLSDYCDKHQTLRFKEEALCKKYPLIHEVNDALINTYRYGSRPTPSTAITDELIVYINAKEGVV